MTTDFLDFLGPTRKALLLAIKERDGATAADLAESTFLSIAATRAHLLVLERAGLISFERRRDGVGRPAHVYRLSERGEALFPQAYADLAEAILGLAEQHPECSALLWNGLEQRQQTALAAAVTARDPAVRVRQLAEAFTLQGYAAEVAQAAEGQWELTMGHCPILSIARGRTQLCELERRLIANAMGEGTTVSHRWRRPDGGAVCVATITCPPARQVTA